MMHIRLVMLLIALFTCAGAQAQFANSSLPIEMEADSTGADANTGKVTFTNIAIRQGPLSIRADRAESSALGFDNSTWTFRGNVTLDAPQSNLSASQMTLRFREKRLESAEFAGSPLRYADKLDSDTRVTARRADVRFTRNAVASVELSGAPIELSRAADEDGQRTEGKADAISYDASTSDLRLTGNAELGEGANRITGNQITYNLISRQVTAAADEQGDRKVHITINPSTGDTTITSDQDDSGTE
ncbi:MAG: LptA/OstA family protein [Pseudomonadota bacterium]